jgi:hypothetical protein
VGGGSGTVGLTNTILEVEGISKVEATYQKFLILARGLLFFKFLILACLRFPQSALKCPKPENSKH